MEAATELARKVGSGGGVNLRKISGGSLVARREDEARGVDLERKEMDPFPFVVCAILLRSLDESDHSLDGASAGLSAEGTQMGRMWIREERERAVI